MRYKNSMLPYDPRLKRQAQRLRKNQTDTERFLWQRLRANQLGYKFRRQHPIAGYIVDFYCDEKRVAIELDGSQHIINKEQDDLRTKRLEAEGITILRFWDTQIFENIEGVLERIYQKRVY